tara:strand:+ start:1410 stop:2477 length:1068 start_codon:yes stop_codon:yes gene_type:complete
MNQNQYYKFIVFITIGFVFAVIPLSINSESSIGYDTNFLKLSEKDIFYGERYPELIGGAKSTSSVVAKQKLSLLLKPSFFGYDSRIYFSMQNSMYLELNEKSYKNYSIRFSQNYGKYKWVKLKYYNTPYNYLREYYDRDNASIYYVGADSFSAAERDSAATYSREKIELELTYPIQGLRGSWLLSSFGKEGQYYNKFFTEYDLDISHYMFGISWRYSKRIRIEAKWTFSYANNVGKDIESNSTIYQDRGYNQKNLWLSFSKRNKKSFIDSYGLTQNIAFRSYTSEFEMYDLLHYNRSHVDWTSSIWLDKKINKNISIKCRIAYRDKDTDAIFAELLKTFNKFEYYLTLKFKILDR